MLPVGCRRFSMVALTSILPIGRRIDTMVGGAGWAVERKTQNIFNITYHLH
jgi:hypothetical protein